MESLSVFSKIRIVRLLCLLYKENSNVNIVKEQVALYGTFFQDFGVGDLDRDLTGTRGAGRGTRVGR